MQYLLINQSTPFNNYAAQGSLDLAFALSTFEQSVQLLFLGDGVLQLLKNQTPNCIYRKNFITSFKALTMYDISAIYVDAASMHKRKINQDDLIIDVELVNLENIVKIMEAANIVFNMG